MDIIIEEPLNSFALKLYQGSRWRYPSMTDVKFLDSQHIVAAHRYSCNVYVIYIDKENQLHTIIDKIQLMYNNKPYQTESFVILNNIIYIISFSNILSFIEILPNLHLKQQQNYIQLDPFNISFHGITCMNHLVYITPSKKIIGTEYILSYNTLNRQLTKVATLGINIRVKCLAFLPNGNIVIAINFKEKTSMVDKSHMFNGEIRLYSPDFTILDTIDIPCTHFDGICCDEYTFYATGANLQNGYIFKGNVQDKNITSLHAYQVHDFPHGIDIMNNNLAYTSYTTSGIHIIDKSILNNIVDNTIIFR
jgi:hypothetical protein